MYHIKNYHVSYKNAIVPMSPTLKKISINPPAPRYVAGEISRWEMNDINDLLNDFTEEQIQKLALSFDWLFSSLDLFTNEVASTELFTIDKRTGQSSAIEGYQDPFIDLLENPNNAMTKMYILRYVLYWMFLSPNGAFLYLVPDDNDPSTIVEIWPIMSDRIKPAKSPRGFVSYFEYRPRPNLGDTQKVYRLPTDYVMWFRYPDPHDYWKSLPPFLSSIRALEIGLGISDAQTKFYAKGRGIPMSIVSVDPNLNEPDFKRVRQDIKNDWADDGTTVAITRGGAIDIKHLGFTRKDLEIISSDQLTRDKVDSIIFGYPFRSDAVLGGRGIIEVDKLIKEKKIYPTHVLLAEMFTKFLLVKFFDVNKKAVFRDVRQQDRALNIQEKNVRSRWMSMNAMLTEENKKPIEVERLPGIGDLPLMLATNAAFVLKYYGIGEGNASHQDDSGDIGNLTDSQSPVQVANQLTDQLTMDSKAAWQEINVEKAIIDGINQELKRWRVVAKRAIERQDRDATDFETDLIPISIKSIITERLKQAMTADDVVAIFDEHIPFEHD
jgi:hypothetical protein